MERKPNMDPDPCRTRCDNGSPLCQECKENLQVLLPPRCCLLLLARPAPLQAVNVVNLDAAFANDDQR
jgi:hypothetical protein